MGDNLTGKIADSVQEVPAITIQEIVSNSSFYLEDVVFALVDDWRSYVKEVGEYLSFKKYLEIQNEHGEGLNQLFAEIVLFKEFL